MKILKFYSDTCGPCKVLSKNLKEAGIEVEEINIENNDNLVDKYNIRNIPTLIKLDDNNTVIDRFTGILSVNDLKEWVYE